MKIADIAHLTLDTNQLINQFKCWKWTN